MQYIVMPLFQTLAGLNVLMCMLGNWGFNVIVKTFKGLERSNWNRRMVTFPHFLFLRTYCVYIIIYYNSCFTVV